MCERNKEVVTILTAVLARFTRKAWLSRHEFNRLAAQVNAILAENAALKEQVVTPTVPDAQVKP